MAEITSPAKIPAGWHQEWLQGFLQVLEEAIEKLEELAADASVIVNEANKEADTMGAISSVGDALEAADNTISILEDVHNYLNVDPKHIGE